MGLEKSLETGSKPQEMLHFVQHDTCFPMGREMGLEMGFWRIKWGFGGHLDKLDVTQNFIVLLSRNIWRKKRCFTSAALSTDCSVPMGREKSLEMGPKPQEMLHFIQHDTCFPMGREKFQDSPEASGDIWFYLWHCCSGFCCEASGEVFWGGFVRVSFETCLGTARDYVLKMGFGGTFVEGNCRNAWKNKGLHLCFYLLLFPLMKK